MFNAPFKNTLKHVAYIMGTSPTAGDMLMIEGIFGQCTSAMFSTSELHLKVDAPISFQAQWSLQIRLNTILVM